MEGNQVTYPFAFFAGLLSFITPCVLPLVPVYLSILSGNSFTELTGKRAELTQDEKKAIHNRVMFNALAFIVGFSIIFIVSGIVAGSLGTWLKISQAKYGPVITNYLLIVFGVVLVFLGVNQAGFWKPMFLNTEARFHLQKGKLGLISSALVGAAFAFGWTPCIGPILALIWGIAAESGSKLQGALLLTAYSLGLAVPFFISALSVNGLIAFTTKMRRHFHTVELVVGCVLILIGLTLGFAGGLGQYKKADGLAPLRSKMGWLENYTTKWEEDLAEANKQSASVEDDSKEKQAVEETEDVGDENFGDVLNNGSAEDPGQGTDASGSGLEDRESPPLDGNGDGVTDIDNEGGFPGSGI